MTPRRIVDPVKTMSSEGTSLEDIENGNVPHTADDAVMNAILSDMNGMEEPVAPPVYIPPPPPPQPEPMYIPEPPPMMHPSMMMYPQQSQQSQQSQHPMYEQVEEPVGSGAVTVKRNGWSTLFDDLRDPLVVGLLVCLFSLPALHTWLAKRLTWAYKVGGSLSWLGFLLQFAIVAGIFATYRQIVTVMGVGA
jgi:hypothetical protein